MTDIPIRVLLVDDHPTVLLGLSTILNGADGVEVVGAELDGARGLAAFERLQPDVVVMDLSMPGESGLQVMQRIHARAPGATVLVLTSSSDDETVAAAMRAGASGYVLKDSDSSEVVRSVRATARGEVPIDARVTRSLVRGDVAPRPAAGLTRRERDVLRLIGLGLANKQVAARLGIGEATVKTHLSSVFQRLGVSDRTSAALWAQAHLEDLENLATR